MGNRKRTPSKGKKINPKFWVFCEGKTEKTYVCYLRSKYRLPIEIIPEVTGSDISNQTIKKHQTKKQSHPSDQIFLLYDADVEEVLNHLKKIANATLLASNPSIEYWFLLHYKNQTANISSKDCIKELNNRNKTSYRKGVIDAKLKDRLDSKYKEACKRAEKTNLFKNPSSNIFEFIHTLEKIRAEKANQD